MMLRMFQILVRVFLLVGGVVGATACGQKGGLVIPTEPAAAQRASLPQSLRPGATPAPARTASAALPTP